MTDLKSLLGLLLLSFIWHLTYLKSGIAKGPTKPTDDRFWNQSGKIGPHCLFSSNIPESLRRKARENYDNHMRKEWTETHLEFIAKVL